MSAKARGKSGTVQALFPDDPRLHGSFPRSMGQDLSHGAPGLSLARCPCPGRWLAKPKRVKVYLAPHRDLLGESCTDRPE